MRTKANLTLFMLILLICAPAAGNENSHSPTPDSPLPNTNTTSTEAPDDKLGSASHSTESIAMKNDTTPASPLSSSSSSIMTSRFRTTHPLPARLSTEALPKKTTLSSSRPINSKLLTFGILLAIMVLMLFAGCLYGMRNKESAQDRPIPRLLLGVRKRLRATVGNLEDRMGLRLWPGGKRGGEDDDEAEGRQGEGGQRLDDGAKGGSCGARNQEEGGCKEEDTYSHDSSSSEGDNLRERAVSSRVEEERKQRGNEDEEETSSASEGGQSAVDGEDSGDKKGGLEEIALVNSVQDDEEKADLSEVSTL